jgi:HAE1 family hydrophobic/amphiphilic exporter-1
VALGIHIVGTGEGGEFRKGLATVLIGGLLTSMFLTLLVVPTAYSLMESFTERFSRLFKRRDEDDDEPLPVPAPAAPLVASGPAVPGLTMPTSGVANGTDTRPGKLEGQAGD